VLASSRLTAAARFAPYARYAPYALYGLLALFFCWPLFEQPLGLGANDWDQHLFYYGAVLKNVVEYGQAPFWNPWYCGGNVLWQNPQIALLSPVYPLAALMPLQLAMKVNIVLHYWSGFAGMHLLLTRVIGVTFLPAIIYVSTLVVASGATAIHLRVGHSVFLPGLYLPLLLYWFFTALKTGELKYLFLAAATMALMVWNGGTHILPMTVAALGTFSLVAAIARRNWRPLAFVAAFGAAGIAYSAPKLLPVAQYVSGEQFWDTRLATETPDVVTREMLMQTYVTPTQRVGPRLPMQRHGWHEYGNYVGLASAALMGSAVVVGLFRRVAGHTWFGVSLSVTSIVLFLLSLGEFSRFAPAVLLQHLPLFENFRIPSRYTIPFVQFAALCVAWAVHTGMQSQRPSRLTRAALGVVLLATVGQLLVTNTWNFRDVFNVAPFETRFHWMAGPREIATDQLTNPYSPGSPMLRALVENRAFFHCYESLQVHRASDPNRALLSVQGTARVSDVTFSPNRVAFNVFGGPEPAKLLLNYNWAPGWSSTAGPIELIGAPGKLATITIPPGQTGRHDFSFRPPGLIAGTIVFAIAVLISTLMWRKRTRPISWVPPPQ
jgi:hypothetical protein